MVNKRDTAETEGLQETFFGMLAYDVLIALERVEERESKTARRDLIRTLFAAIEGFAWELRNHVRLIADDLGNLKPLEVMALTEASYSVSESGNLVEQQRYVALPSMIKLATRIAKNMCPNLDADFSDDGWADLKSAIAIRNRITHPKSVSDLNISPDDTKIVWSGFIWLLRHVRRIMEASVSAQADYLSELNDWRLYTLQTRTGFAR